MAEQLAYLMITPYSLAKSRTGAIIARALSVVQAELVAVHMMAPSDEFVDEFLDSVRQTPAESRGTTHDALLAYIDENLRSRNPMGISNRVMVLLFRGENVVEHLRQDIVGTVKTGVAGDTIRGSFGDFLAYPDGRVRYFEPAVICGLDNQRTMEQLAIISKYASRDGGVIEKAVKFEPGRQAETSLVILKPDNFYTRSRRAGSIIDIFSKTGLFIVGAKLQRMTVAQGEQFYGPLKDVFRRKLVGKVVDVARQRLRDAFDFQLPDDVYERIGDMLRDANAETEFAKIVEYMTGINPLNVPPEQKNQPGTVQSLALLYRGEGAIEKIRRWLGATDPSKADFGTVRSDFGRDLMRNAAHASDSVENAERERKIVGLWQSDDNPEIKQIIDQYLHAPQA